MSLRDFPGRGRRLRLLRQHGGPPAGAAARRGRALVVEARAHIGGNSHSQIDAQTGIEFHTYGSHIFHTPNKAVWDFITQFSAFNNYRHRVFTQHGSRMFTMPINLMTINAYYGRSFTPAQARDFLQEEIARDRVAQPDNLEDKAISLVGRPLYQAFIEGYTRKQWETDLRGPAAGDHHPPAGPVRLQRLLFLRSLRGDPGRWLRRHLRPDAASAQHPHGHELRLRRTSRRNSTRRRWWFTPGRSTPSTTTDSAHSAGAPWNSSTSGPRPATTRALPSSTTRTRKSRSPRVHEFRHLHPERRHPEDRDADRPGILALRTAGRRAVLPDQHGREQRPLPAVCRPCRAGNAHRVRRTARHLPIPRHAPGDRRGDQVGGTPTSCRACAGRPCSPHEGVPPIRPAPWLPHPARG